MVLMMILLSLSGAEAVGGLLNRLKGKKGNTSATTSPHQSLEAAREARERTEGKMKTMVRTKADQMKYPAEIKIGKGWKSYVPGSQDYRYKKLQNRKEKQDAHIGKLERETGTSTHHQASSLRQSAGSASPGDRSSPSKKSSSSISLNGGRIEDHQHDRREDLLMQIAGERGRPVRQGGKGIKTMIPNTKEAEYHSVNKKVIHAEHPSTHAADKGKGKAIDLGSSPKHSISASDISHSDHRTAGNKYKEEIYAYQNSQSLPVNANKSGLPSRPGLSSFYSPARSEGRSLFGGSSVGSAKGTKNTPKQDQLSPVGKNIERRIKNSKSPERQQALRQILTVGGGVRSSRKVYENKEKMEEIDLKLRGKNGSDRFSAMKKHIPGTNEHARAIAKKSHDKHFRRMENIAHDVGVHAEKGTMDPKVLSEISEYSDIENQHRAMLKLEKQASPHPPRHSLSPMHRGQSSSALHSLASPDNSSNGIDYVESSSTI